jgi:hypothetical protein
VKHPSIGVEMMPVTPTLAAQLNQQAARGREQQQQQQGAAQAADEQEQQQQQQGNRKGGNAKQQQPSAPALTPQEEEAAAAMGAAGQIHYIPEGGAVVVINVLPGSPAQRAGLRNLDILLEIDRRPIYRVEDAQRMIQAAGVGRDLEVKVLRRTQEVTLRVRTTDFLSLFRRQQANKRFPELKRGGVEEGSEQEEGQQERRQQRRRGAGGEEEEDAYEEEDVMGGLSRHQHATKGREREGNGGDRAGAGAAAEAEEQAGEGVEEDEDGLGAAGGDGQREDRACSRGDGLRGHLYC